MNLVTFSIAASLILSGLAHASPKEVLRGIIEKQGDHFRFVSPEGSLKITASEKVMASLPSLANPPFVSQASGDKYAFEVSGEFRGSQFYLDQVPTKVAGIESISGVLEFYSPTGAYEINGRSVKFGVTKMTNGYEFDEYSRASYVGKEVVAEGNPKGEVLEINALTPVGVFSAASAAPLPRTVSEKLDAVGAERFLIHEMAKNELSQSREPFRVTVAGGGEVSPGESALIITLSGRQGDSFGAVNGHFAAGGAEVQNDLSLRAEVSNAYVTNEKDILSGNTALTSYYFHLVQGQNNYRPTYTLIAYGVAPEKLASFRDSLEEAHIAFRSTTVPLTPQFNCTTETVKALQQNGIRGRYTQADNAIAGILTAPLGIRQLGTTPNVINFSFRNDPARFHPRAAYNSFVKSFLSSNFRREHGISRVDFVFYPQLRSARPVGGISLGKIFQAPKFNKLEQKYELQQKLSPEELRPLLKFHLDAIE